MTRYVVLHKLSRGFEKWDDQGTTIKDYPGLMPYMNNDFMEWYHENFNQIKTVHAQRMVEYDRTEIALEFHNEDEALVCMLRFA